MNTRTQEWCTAIAMPQVWLDDKAHVLGTFPASLKPIVQ